MVLVLSPILGLAQTVLPNDEGRATTIEWTAGRLLTWKDYNFRRVRREGNIAITSVKHSVRGYMRNNMPEFDIKVMFMVADSWTSDTTDIALLEHERLHFDIGELFRRKIALRIIELQKQGEKKASVYRLEIKNVLNEFNSFSRAYDKESEHGRNSEEQLQWQKRVKEELYRLHK